MGLRGKMVLIVAHHDQCPFMAACMVCTQLRVYSGSMQ